MSHIAFTLAVPDLTGASRMAYYYAQALVENGHQVTFVHGAMPVDGEGKEASIVGELKELGVACVEIAQLAKPIPPFIYGKVEAVISGCNAVVGMNQRDRSVALEVANRLNVPGIVAMGNNHNFHGRFGLGALKRHYYKRTLVSKACQVICTSEITFNESLEFGVERHKLTLLNNGIHIRDEVTEEARESAREMFTISSDERVFLNVGRIDEQKGQDLLVKAWYRCTTRRSEDQLWIVGDTTEGNLAASSQAYKNDLIRLIDELDLGNSVKLLGWRNDVDQLLAAADGYLYSSRWDGLPLAVLEAMASSLPVLMTDCCGTIQGFEEGVHGYMAETGSVESLLEKMNMLLGFDKERTRCAGQSARMLCSHRFDIQKIGKQFVDVLESCMNPV